MSHRPASIQPTPSPARIRFPGWELRPAERLLLVANAPVPVGARAFDLLCLLVSRRGELVRKGELLEAIWPGLVVEENNISVQVAALRKWLGPHAIATVPGLGYRLSAQPVADPRATPATTQARHTSDSVAELIGRDDELQQLLELLGDAQSTGLLTLVGPGGVGKTSLAREAMHRHTVLGGRACHWIDLAPLRDAGEWLPALARALGVELGGGQSAAEGLLPVLARLEALVVLDNCEHLSAEVAGFLSQALPRARGVRWLATSQVPLHCAGERVERLAPLAVPPFGLSVVESLEFGALALLCQRAVAADPRFRLDEAVLDSAVALCRTLDGLPLAIEMAAARVAALGLAEIGTQLGERLRLRARNATEARHATVRATLDWSYGLLDPAEQRAFRRLGVFVGGFRIALATAVLNDAENPIDAWDAAELIAMLVEKSLVQRSPAAGDRLFLLETARDYALQCSEQSGELSALRHRHAEVVARDCERASADSEQMPDTEWAARYLAERANVRSALACVCAQEAPPADLAARLVASFAVLDTLFYRDAEIARWQLPLEQLATATPPWRARACLELSWAHYADGQRDFGSWLAESAFDDLNALGDTSGAYRALAQLVRLYESQPGMQEEAAHARARLLALGTPALTLRQKLFTELSCGLLERQHRSVATLMSHERQAAVAGFQVLVAVCHVLNTDALLIAGRHAEVIDCTRRAIVPCTPFPRLLALLHHNEAMSLAGLGRHDEALHAARCALRASPQLLPVFDTLACLAAEAGRAADSALLLGYSRHRHESRAEAPDPAESIVVAALTDRLREALGAESLQGFLRDGAALSQSEALGLAQLTPAARGAA